MEALDEAEDFKRNNCDRSHGRWADDAQTVYERIQANTPKLQRPPAGRPWRATGLQGS
jgi:hypothetical protein